MEKGIVEVIDNKKPVNLRDEINNDLIGYLKTKIDLANKGGELQKLVEDELLMLTSREPDDNGLTNSQKIKLLEVLYKYNTDRDAGILGVLKESQKIQINNVTAQDSHVKNVTEDFSQDEMKRAKKTLKILNLLSNIEETEGAEIFERQ